MIRDYFQDDLSKYIFDNRIEYKDSGDEIFINNIAEKCCPELFKARENFVKFICECNEDIYFWGAGLRLGTLLYYLKGREKLISGIFDKDSSKWGSKISGIEVLPPEKIKEKGNCCVIITPVNSHIINEIGDEIRKINSACIIKKGLDFVNSVSLANQYFEDFMALNEGEVFVDGGAYDLETTIEFNSRCKMAGLKNYKSIAFEPGDELFNNCQKRMTAESIANVRLEKYGLWSKTDTLRFSNSGDGSSIDDNGSVIIKAIDLDSIIDEKVTFIKMDVEGAEIEALNGARRLIETYKPKLAISVYHKKDDIVTIPELIKSLVPEYRMFLRHYTPSLLETVVYAVV